MKCKELGLQNDYAIECDGKQVIFTRKRLTTKAFTELEKLRAQTEKENSESKDAIEAANRQADLYLHIAQAYLSEKDTGQPITKEQFVNTIWEEIKLILSACHLRTMLGTPNAAPASGT